VVHEPADGSPEKIFDEFPLPPRQYEDVLKVTLPEKFVKKIKGLDTLRLEFVVGKTVKMRRLNTITGEPTSDSGLDTTMAKTDCCDTSTTTADRVKCIMHDKDCTHKIVLTLLKVSVDCPVYWSLNAKDDTENFSIRDFLLIKEFKGDGKWCKLRNIEIKNRIL
jgi:hypothetical protein